MVSWSRNFWKPGKDSANWRGIYALQIGGPSHWRGVALNEGCGPVNLTFQYWPRGFFYVAWRWRGVMRRRYWWLW